jgi:hypothetical protein
MCVGRVFSDEVDLLLGRKGLNYADLENDSDIYVKTDGKCQEIGVGTKKRPCDYCPFHECNYRVYPSINSQTGQTEYGK